MNGCLHVIRDGEEKLTLPGPSIIIKSDGTIWVGETPLLGVREEEKKGLAVLVKSKKYEEIPAVYYTRLGDNPNGLWVGNDEMYQSHPVNVAAWKKREAKKETEKYTITIYLSSRGWGDYSPVEWIGDVRRPVAEIVVECQRILAGGHDVDTPNQSPEEIAKKIEAEKAKFAAKIEAEKAEENKVAEKIEEAKRTGKKIEIESWVTHECKNGNDNECSFDNAVRWAMPDGKIKVTYSCCF